MEEDGDMAPEPAVIAELRRALGARLTAFRDASGLTQGNLGSLVFRDRTTVNHIEKARARGDEQFWRDADRAVQANGALLTAFLTIEAHRHVHEQRIRGAELAKARARVAGWQGQVELPHFRSNVTLDKAEAWPGDLADTLDVVLASHGDAAQKPSPLSLIAKHTVQVMEAFSEHDLMSRRHMLQRLSVLSGVALSKPVRQWVACLPLVPVAAGVGSAELDELEQAVRLFRRWDASGVGGLKRKAVVGQLHAVAEMLRDVPDSATSNRLFQITAELAQLAGWMSYDQGFSGAAQRYYFLSLHACREAGASGLGAKVIGDMMQLATALGHYDDSLNLARAGLYSLSRKESSLVRAELLGLEARAYAQLGPQEAAEAVRSVENCVSIWHERRDEVQPDWLHYMNQSEVDCLAANTYIQLALAADDRVRWRYYGERAMRYALSARDARASGYDRSRILDEVRLAKVWLAHREPVESIRVATNAIRLAERVSSSVVCDWFICFHDLLVSRYAGLAEVAGFTEQLRNYLRRTAPLTKEREVVTRG